MIILQIIGLLALATPLVWEVFNDRKGDNHMSRGPIKALSKRLDVFARGLLAVGASLLNFYLTAKNFWASLLLSGAVHFMFFDYIIAYVLIRGGVIVGHWFNYIGTKSAIDNMSGWKQRDPMVKLLLRLLFFGFAMTVYVFIKR